MGKLTIKKFKGINSTKAALQLQTGEIPFLQNFRGRPFDNLSKRRGVEPSSTQTGPVQGIFDLEFDGLIMPMFIVNGTLQFYPSTATVTWPDPDSRPFQYPLNSANVGTALLVEPSMRAIQERAIRAADTPITWPNIIFNASGGKLNGNTGIAPASQNISDYFPSGVGTAQFPVDKCYQYDMQYHDASFGNPTGTRAAFLVNEIWDAISDEAPFYHTEPEGDSATSISSYDDVTIGLPSPASVATYRQTLTNMKPCIRLMTNVIVNGVLVDCEFRDGNIYMTSPEPTCVDAQNAAVTLYNANSYSAGSTILFEEAMDETGGDYEASIANERGKFQVDLTDYPGTSATIYASAVGTLLQPAFNPCFILVDGNLRAVTTVTPGALATTGLYGGTPTLTFSVCPPPDYTRSWQINPTCHAYVDISPFVNNV